MMLCIMETNKGLPMEDLFLNNLEVVTPRYTGSQSIEQYYFIIAESVSVNP